MTPIKDTARWTAVVVSAIYSAVMALYFHTHFPWWIKTPLALIPAVITVAIVVYDKWAWKWPILSKFHSRPMVFGLWLATLTPSMDSHIPDGGNRGPIRGYFVIEQTYWTTSVILMTAESRSVSLSARFSSNSESAATQLLRFMYENQPKVAVRDRSNRHTGQCELHVPGASPKSLEATYFTDRLTRGDITLEKLTEDVDNWSFETAEALARSHRDEVEN